MKIYSNCFLLQYPTKDYNITNCSNLTGNQYTLNQDTNQYILQKENRRFTDYISLFPKTVFVNKRNKSVGTAIEYYQDILRLITNAEVHLSQKDCDSFEYSQEYILLFNHIMLFHNNNLPISALALAQLHHISTWGIINTVLNVSSFPDYFSRIQPNFSTVFFCNESEPLINFANELVQLINCYKEN